MHLLALLLLVDIDSPHGGGKTKELGCRRQALVYWICLRVHLLALLLDAPYGRWEKKAKWTYGALPNFAMMPVAHDSAIRYVRMALRLWLTLGAWESASHPTTFPSAPNKDSSSPLPPGSKGAQGTLQGRKLTRQQVPQYNG